jgi:hypothetical protein
MMYQVDPRILIQMIKSGQNPVVDVINIVELGL